MQQPYIVFHRGSVVGEFSTYALANKTVLDQSGAPNIWEAVGWHVESRKPHLVRALVSTNGSGLYLGKRPAACFSWEQLYTQLKDGVWSCPRGQSRSFEVSLEFSDGTKAINHLDTYQSADPSEERQALGRDQLRALFDPLAETHELFDVLCDWPAPLAV
jgi:hypothetical protein